MATSPNKANKRTKAQIEADLVIVEELTLRGVTQVDIAAHLAAIRPYTLCRQQIQADQAKLKARWRKESARMVENIINQDLKTMALQERELWIAWNKSKEDADTRYREEALARATPGVQPTGTPQNVKMSQRKETQCGDVSYQNAISAIRKERAEYLGLIAAKKSEVNLNGQMVVVQAPFDPTEVTGPAPEEKVNGKDNQPA